MIAHLKFFLNGSFQVAAQARLSETGYLWRRRLAGISLVEVLVSCGLVLLVMAMATQITCGAYKSYSSSEKKAGDFRQAAIALDLLSRELRTVEKVVFPLSYSSSTQWKKGRLLTVSAGQSCTVILQRANLPNNRARYLALHYDGQSGRLYRHLLTGFSMSGLPGAVSTRSIALATIPGVVRSKVLAAGIGEFSFATANPQQCFGANLISLQIKIKARPKQNLLNSPADLRVTTQELWWPLSLEVGVFSV